MIYHRLKIQVSTWMKDSHGLYDYESVKQLYQTESIKVQPPVNLFHNKSFISALSSRSARMIQQVDSASESPEQQLEEIVKITKTHEKNQTIFHIEPLKNSLPEQNQYDPQKTLYHSIRNGNNEKKTYPLSAGMILKFGRVEYRIIQLKDYEDVTKFCDPQNFFNINPMFEASEKSSVKLVDGEDSQENHRCRVCLCEEESFNDPLISPCFCKGSILKIHLGCLKRCIDCKIKKEAGDVGLQFVLSKMSCQLCHHPYPRVIKIAENEHQMLKIKRPQTPYIILETLNQEKLSLQQPNIPNPGKSLILINLNQNGPTKIGRGYQCHIRLTDISVSRNHAQILLQNNKFVIQDTKSKFGTLIKINSPLSLKMQKNQESVKLQYGRSLFELSIESEEIEPQGKKNRASSKQKQKRMI